MDGLKLVWLALVFIPSLCSAAFSYTCYPDDTIEVSGLGAGTTGVFAKNSDGVNCTTTAPGDTVNITGCDKDKYIVFSFGSYTDMLTNQIVGGMDISVVNITCNEIEATPHNITNSFEASIQFNETTDFGVTYSVSSDLSKTVANVGDEVIWSIHFPSDYILEIHACFANPGTTYSEATSIQLIHNYCSDITDLISAFVPTPGLATATINAFKFYDNDNVFLLCRLTVCPANDLSCITSCSSKKREVAERGSSDSRFTAEVGQVLRIIDPDANAAQPISGLSITFTILVVLTSLL